MESRGHPGVPGPEEGPRDCLALLRARCPAARDAFPYLGSGLVRVYEMLALPNGNPTHLYLPNGRRDFPNLITSLANAIEGSGHYLLTVNSCEFTKTL